MSKTERNTFTGITGKSPSNDILNPLTGIYRAVDESDDIAKSSSSLWPSITGQTDDSDNSFEKHVPIFVKKADEHIVCGIVYQPDVVDSQGDEASAEEIKKACYLFMEKARVFKVMHKGKKVKVEILENYIAPQNLTIGEKKIKKGTWLMTVRINDDKIWKQIKAGTLTGFSMAGEARIDD